MGRNTPVHSRYSFLTTLGYSIYCGKNSANNKNKFWIDVFRSHMQLSSKQTPTEMDHFQTNPLFLNENIKIGNKPVYNKSCIDNRIQYINDIIKQDGNFLHMRN